MAAQRCANRLAADGFHASLCRGWHSARSSRGPLETQQDSESRHRILERIDCTSRFFLELHVPVCREIRRRRRGSELCSRGNVTDRRSLSCEAACPGDRRVYAGPSAWEFPRQHGQCSHSCQIWLACTLLFCMRTGPVTCDSCSFYHGTGAWRSRCTARIYENRRLRSLEPSANSNVPLDHSLWRVFQFHYVCD